VICSAVFLASEADAKRLGGGRSTGAQRNVTAPPASTPAKPAQAQPGQPQQPQAAPAPQGSRWGGILGGLAIGGLLGYLLGANGMAGGVMGMLLLAALIFGGVMLVRMLTRPREQAPVQTLQYASGLGEERVAMPVTMQAGASAPLSSGPVPAGFDSAGFLRAAKMNFVKLQLANDAGQLDDIREFTTHEMFDALRQDVLSRPSTSQQTDVLNLNADLLEVATEKNEHWASVRFSGQVRETRGTDPVGFEEVWNLVKPADGSGGWLLAGIQQMH
jgi:predicted lipid-binding transport protein (Tim44 family)